MAPHSADEAKYQGLQESLISVEQNGLTVSNLRVFESIKD